jgi:ribonuclease-3
MEFLGDSVLSLVVASYLYERYPNENEGFLTKVRTRLVNGNMLAHLSDFVNISPWLIISHQIEENEGRKNKKLLEDALEAIIGAIYIDFDFDTAKEWVINLIEENIDFCDLLNVASYKDTLFKSYQFNFQKGPIFEELGRTHSTNSNSTSNSNSFKDNKEKDKVTICVKDPNGSIISIGYGTNKKDAENDAAKNALTLLGWL